MASQPIASREARVICRRPMTYHARWLVAGLGLIGIVFAIWLASGGEQGDTIFITLGAVAQVYALFAGVIVAGDAIASERREQTLGLLFLTDLRPRHVLLGKLLASSATACFGLMAFIPLLVIPQLLGGVTIERFWMLALHLVNTLFLSITCGFLCSTIFRAGWVSITFGVSWMFAQGLAFPFLLIWFEWDWGEQIAFLTPVCGWIALWEQTSIEYEFFWDCFLFHHCFAWAGLGIVAARLVYIWNDRPRTVQQQRRFEAVTALRYGNRRARAGLRAKLLDQNPLAWLGNRDQVSSSGLLLLTFAMFMAVSFLMLFTQDWWLDRVIGLAVAALFIAHLALFFRICLAAAYDLAEDRKSGALELLLSTSIRVREIILGRWLGLGRRFFGPVVVILFFQSLFVVFTALNMDKGEVSSFPRRFLELQLQDSQINLLALLSAMALLPLNWIAAIWLGMWLGLRLKKSATAVWFTLLIVLVAPWLLLGLVWLAFEMLGLSRFSFVRVSDTETAVGVIILAAAYAGIVMHFARRKLFRNFREAAADRFMEYRRPFPWARVRRHAFRLACAGAVALGLTLLWRDQADGRGERAWQAALAAHPHFSLEESGPFQPVTIPPEENLAECALLKPLSDPANSEREDDRIRRRGPNIPIYALRNPFTPSYPSRTNVYIQAPNLPRHWARGEFLPLEPFEAYLRRREIVTNRAGSPARSIRLVFADSEKIFSELQAAAEERPKTRFARNIQYIAHINTILSMRAIVRLRMDEPAFPDVTLMLRLSEGFCHLPPDYAAIVPVFQPVFEGLAQRRWKDHELRELQTAVARVDYWRAHLEACQEHIRAQIAYIDRLVAESVESENLVVRLQAGLRTQGSVLKAKARLLRLAAEDFPSIIQTGPRLINRGPIPALETEEITTSILNNEVALGPIEWTRNFAFIQTTLDQIQIAAAIERFRLKYGRFPEALAQLAPEFMATVPHDIMTGRPMLYRAEGGDQAFELYSAGWDAIDNGGNPGPRFFGYFPEDVRGIDWVWIDLKPPVTSPRDTPGE